MGTRRGPGFMGSAGCSSLLCLQVQLVITYHMCTGYNIITCVIIYPMYNISRVLVNGTGIWYRQAHHFNDY